MKDHVWPTRAFAQRARSSLFSVGLVIATIVAAVIIITTASRPAPVQAQGQTNLVLAFYYAWYSPQSFGPGKTAYQPAQPYQSSDPATIQRHVSQARAAGIDGFVQSWYGPSEPVTNGNFQALLDVAAANGFKAAIDFEPGVAFSNNDQRAAALQTLLATHATHPAYLRVDGKPVIFFWANWAYSVDDWAYIRSIADPGHTSIWLAEGSRTEYLQVFDGLHLYNIAWSANPHGIASTWGANTRAAAESYGAFKYWVATAMPGFDDRHLGRGEASVYRDRANGAYYQNSFAAAAASSPDMLLITSFNEWAEGSNIEPSTAFGATYLDLTAQLVSGYKSGGVAPPPPLPQPTAEPTAEQSALMDEEENIGTIAQAPTATGASPGSASPTPLPDGRIVYEVQAGDTLSAIAFRFNVSLQELYVMNDLNEDSLLSVGQPIVIGVGQGVTGEATASAAQPATPQTTTAAQETYEVTAGDTLLGIAFQHDLTIEELLALNPTLSETTLLQLGQVIVISQRQEPLSVGGSTDFPGGTATAAAPQPSPSATAQQAPTAPTAIPTQALAAFTPPSSENASEGEEGAGETEQGGPDEAAPEATVQGTPQWLILVLAFVLLAGGGGAILYVLGSRKP